MIPKALTRDVDLLNVRGLKLSVLELDGQPYVHVPELRAPSPPWDRAAYEILVSVPMLYDQASLDGFYLRLPYKYNGGEHPRVNGAVIKLGGHEWRLVSWHYLDGKPWRAGQDSLDSHIEHSKGFFLARGVKG